ncbi:MAG: NAD(P)-dependent oxidoreductase [Candidatus Hermodarchaeota archaeon]
MTKPKIYFTSNVFTENEIGSIEKISQKIRDDISNLWNRLYKLADIKIFSDRFPSNEEIKEEIENFKPDILCCHLSHEIRYENLEKSNIFAVLTSTAGYDHIQRMEEDDIIITHTPGILHESVADFSIALILSNLRNITDLHNYVWNGDWTTDDKWDQDQNLSTILSNKTLGIVGLGEIGSEIVKKLYSWGSKIIYTSRTRKTEFEMEYPRIEYFENIEDIFRKSDIVSLNIPLNKSTENLVNEKLLRLMKKDALLINTARGGIIDFNALLELLENKKIQLNLSFDVYPEEPLNPKVLKRLKRIKKEQPNLRFILMPHNASADADTRGKMVLMLLEDLLKIIESKKIEDLNDIHLIPEHKAQLETKDWRIHNYWNKKE